MFSGKSVVNRAQGSLSTVVRTDKEGGLANDVPDILAGNPERDRKRVPPSGPVVAGNPGHDGMVGRGHGFALSFGERFSTSADDGDVRELWGRPRVTGISADYRYVHEL
jgi:hypothetical protein